MLRAPRGRRPSGALLRAGDRLLPMTRSSGYRSARSKCPLLQIQFLAPARIPPLLREMVEAWNHRRVHGALYAARVESGMDDGCLLGMEFLPS